MELYKKFLRVEIWMTCEQFESVPHCYSTEKCTLNLLWDSISPYSERLTERQKVLVWIWRKVWTGKASLDITLVIPQKLQLYLPHDPTVLLLSINSKVLYFTIDIFAHPSLLPLYSQYLVNWISKPRSSLTSESIVKMWLIKTMDFFPAVYISEIIKFAS